MPLPKSRYRILAIHKPWLQAKESILLFGEITIDHDFHNFAITVFKVGCVFVLNYMSLDTREMSFDMPYGHPRDNKREGQNAKGTWSAFHSRTRIRS